MKLDAREEAGRAVAEFQKSYLDLRLPDEERDDEIRAPRRDGKMR